MNAQEWQKLRKNWSKLLRVPSKEICIYLFQIEVLSYNDKEKVQKAGTTADEMEQLLIILNKKKNGFRYLMEAMEKDPELKYLVDEITNTESSADSSLCFERDSLMVHEKVRDTLHKFLTNKVGEIVSLADVREILDSQGVFLHHNQWSNTEISNFIKNEFVGVEVIQEKRRERKKAKPVISFKNLGIVRPQEQAAGQVQQEPAERKLRDMKPSELRNYLTTQFTQNDYNTEELANFETEGISGKIFITMKEEDFVTILPSSNFGMKRLLTMLIKDNLETDSSEMQRKSEEVVLPDHFRSFDHDVEVTDKYNLGHCVDVSLNARGKKTTPIRRFHLIEGEDADTVLELMAAEVVPFASACLNDRRNGTIFFGISPWASEKHKAGEIVGMSLDKTECQMEINSFLKKSFADSQKNIISSTVRDARFIPVVGRNQAQNFVVEVDVVPTSVVLDKAIIRTKLKHLPNHTKNHKEKTAVFRFSEDGEPMVASAENLIDYERDQQRIIEQRKQEESLQSCEPPANLRIKLRNWLTGGPEVIEDGVYFFLVTSPIDSHMHQEYLLQNMNFIKKLDPEVVFDFDPKGSTDGLYHNLDSQQNEEMRVLTTDNFDRNLIPKLEDYNSFVDSLGNENRISWIFCNGYEAMNFLEMEPKNWNKNRRTAFQNTLNVYKDNFDVDRIIIIIFLFSKNYSATIEACDEILTKFPEQWVLIAETENIAKLWKDQMLSRCRVDKADLDRCVVGMPWHQVNETVNNMIVKQDTNKCTLPCSNGALVEVKQKKLKDWSDIDLLSAGEFEISEDKKEVKNKMKQAEENFYRGEQVSWLNFYFHDQVLKRRIHDEFKVSVDAALNEKGEEDKVTTVVLMHQPGSGGTTSARQILWDLRKQYRCCVVNTITDQTGEQLDEIRAYDDKTPRPLLVLIDNEDEDKYIMLREKLEERGRRRWRDEDEHPFQVYCTIILCVRRASLPKQLKSKIISLRQELSREELHWFKEKNEKLTSQFEKNKEKHVNPKFLISFNILRKNFDKDYVSKVVKEFSDDVKEPKEVKLLTIVSLLNNYDPDFKPIRVSCLDRIIYEQRGHRQVKPYSRNISWEANLSQAVKVLLNLSSNKNHPGRARKSLRVFNKIIALEILNKMKERTNQSESEIMHQLMNSGVFDQTSYDAKHLQSVINSVMKKREFMPDGKKKHKFSQFILTVQKNEAAETAVGLLVDLFELNHDPFTAQLIARFYIELKNWDKAEYFAKRATGMLPNCSFLWDTYGQVFKNQMYNKIDSQKSLDKAEGFAEKEIHELIQLAEKCIDCFRHEQRKSEREVTTNGENNFAGYFGELRAIVILLSALELCPTFSKGNLHDFLVDPNYQLSCFDKSETEFLKHLEKYSSEAMRRLDEEYLQMKGSINLDVITPNADFNKKSLLGLKENLDAHFGETTDVAPLNLNEEDKCEYRYRRARNLGATSLHLLLKMRQERKQDTLLSIYDLLLKNVNSASCRFDDLRAMLDTVTVLLLDDEPPPGLKYENILEWSKKLYLESKPSETNRWYLEPYLYFVLYNFPTQERQEYELCLPINLINALTKWHEAFKTNYPKFEREQLRIKRKDTTLFFLGNGRPLYDIVHQDSLEVMNDASLREKWRLPGVREKLQLQTGLLQHGGENITYNIKTKEGNNFEIIIPTSHKVTKRNMWQKKVYFYIGFSFSGPRGFGISLEEPPKAGAVPLRVKATTIVNTSRLQKQIPSNLPILIVQRFDILRKIEQARYHPRLKDDLVKRKQEIEKEIDLLVGKF
ncbi:sterile alpha motif domain-containing protein 9-like [Physella acuta]|uniref:sterile alpha motif domain-containing protein 9-like n=1 Tax=Physella acuta TaxID=109671 RepID=UPI0027DE6FF9|nr:sterile alpha motif domain-containing protein 9-like [Physella acuta]